MTSTTCDRLACRAGRPLDAPTRALMERRLAPVAGGGEHAAERAGEQVLRRPAGPGVRFDFSRVRVHTDDRAAAAAHAFGANAFTVGEDITFAAGRYGPGTAAGDRLLAHELTHVVQQRATGPRMQRQPAAPSSGPATGLTQDMLEQVAAELRRAMEGWGTDEEAIFSALAGRTQAQVDAIERVYGRLYGRSLSADLQDELSASDLDRLAIFAPGSAPGSRGTPSEQASGLAEMVALQLQRAMAGIGTDESSILAALSGRSAPERQAIADAYKRLTGTTLEADLRDELSGSDLFAALALLHQGMYEPEDEIMLAVHGLGTDEDRLFAALRKIQGKPAAITKAIDEYADKGYGDMLDDIREDLSGDELERAMEMLHGHTKSAPNCSPDQRARGLEGISEATSLGGVAVNKLDADVARGALSGDVETALTDNFNPGGLPNAVNVNLARTVRPVLATAVGELLNTASITCGPNPGCKATSGEASAFTFPSLGQAVHLCPLYFSLGEPGVTVLHEFVHHSGIREARPEAVYKWKPNFRQLVPSGNGSVTDSLHCADSFAYFAKEVH